MNKMTKGDEYYMMTKGEMTKGDEYYIYVRAGGKTWDKMTGFEHSKTSASDR